MHDPAISCPATCSARLHGDGALSPQPLPSAPLQLVEMEVGPLALALVDVDMVQAQPPTNTGVVAGGERVEGGASPDTGYVARPRSSSAELIACGSWVQVGGDASPANRKVGLVAAYVWSDLQRRLIPRVVLGAQSTPAWRDVAASTLRVISPVSVGLCTKQEVGLAIQAQGELLFTNASIAVTDWPSTQVMFPPGYVPPVPPGRRQRQCTQLPRLVQLTTTGARRSRPPGSRSVRQPHTKVQRCKSVDPWDMETATEDSTYADNASMSGSDADRYAECNRYEHCDPSQRPARLLALPAPPTGRNVSGRGPST